MPKKGPWSLGERGKENPPGGRGWGKACLCSIERATWGPPPSLEGIYMEISGEDSSRIFISFSGMSSQGHGLY